MTAQTFHLDGDTIIVNGREAGWVTQGEHGWYALPLSALSHAHPLGSLDNVRGFGFATAEAAAAAWLAS